MGTPADAQELTKERSWNVAENGIQDAETPPKGVPLNILAGVTHPCLWTGPGQPWEPEGSGPSERAQRAAGPFLVPRGNNSITVSEEAGRELSPGRCFEIEVCAAVAKFGVEHAGLWTSTPGDLNVLGEFEKVTDASEASRRWNSLRTSVIGRREEWRQWALVMQRHKDGGVHYHVLVVHRDDIRGSLDFEALKRRDYRTANAALRAEWTCWRQTAKLYGFGRVEFLPIYDANGAGRYLARYLRREIGTRREGDAHAQLFRFSRSWERVVHGEACWADTRAKRAMRRAAEIGLVLWGSEDAMVSDLGEHWKWKLRRILWCSDDCYENVLLDAHESRQIHGGGMLCLEDAFARFDQRTRASTDKNGFAARRRGKAARWEVPDEDEGLRTGDKNDGRT